LKYLEGGIYVDAGEQRKTPLLNYGRGSGFNAAIGFSNEGQTKISGVRDWLERVPNMAGVYDIFITHPGTEADVHWSQWLWGTSRPMVSLGPYWISVISAGLLAPRLELVTTRLLPGFCPTVNPSISLENHRTVRQMGIISGKINGLAGTGASDILALKIWESRNVFTAKKSIFEGVTSTVKGERITSYTALELDQWDGVEGKPNLMLALLCSMLIGMAAGSIGVYTVFHGVLKVFRELRLAQS